MIREIRPFGDPILRTTCDPVRGITPGTRSVVRDLLDTVDQPGRAGVAANQIGVGLRIFSYLVDGDLGYLINPELVSATGEQSGPEGCLSVPGHSFEVTRPDRVEVTGIDLDGAPVTVVGTGLLARALLHELDHLDGRLYIDLLPGSRRREVLRAFR
ncbi:peptide deformylase [Pseudactinotalea sp. HY160]|uniref:peptide deformylase n=1 Tax=Pseudactinotalea sp. HY160 TaxID=2654490 RepID=UPI00128BACD5|nr:peptide deformylase [Pseudactinotalea sp. HY160]MPV49792.1 peptide deformylase [Pseudactinotalea sp. HY160]